MSAGRELTLQHTGCAEGTRSSHPWEGEGGHGCIDTHRSTPRWWLFINTHGASIWRCALHGTWLFRQENITAPVPASASVLFFSLGFWSYFWFAKIAPLEAAFLIGGIVSP